MLTHPLNTQTASDVSVNARPQVRNAPHYRFPLLSARTDTFYRRLTLGDAYVPVSVIDGPRSQIELIQRHAVVPQEERNKGGSISSLSSSPQRHVVSSDAVRAATLNKCEQRRTIVLWSLVLCFRHAFSFFLAALDEPPVAWRRWTQCRL